MRKESGAKMRTKKVDSPVKPEKSVGGIKTRKSKGKSRLGCSTCKKGRVKCDEARPKCTRCKNGSHDCVYAIDERPVWKSGVKTFILPVAEPEVIVGCITVIRHPSDDPTRTLGISRPPTLYPPISFESCMMGAQDMFLLRHFITHASIDLVIRQDVLVNDALPLAFQNTFLMHIILAMSARHLQTTANTQQSHYALLEAQHLHKTLSSFRANLQTSTQADHDALVGTGLLLCFHSCSDLQYNPRSFPPGEDTTFTFLRGMTSIVASSSYQAHRGLFKEIFDYPALLPRQFPRTEPIIGPAVVLVNLLEEVSLSPERKTIYIDRIETLTLYLSTSAMQGIGEEEMEELLLSFLRWQTFCPEVFVSLLKANDPIAMIIMAHYYAAVGFLLGMAKGKWWWWQQKPQYMVETIAEFLGCEWAAWMEWPNMTIERCKIPSLELTL